MTVRNYPVPFQGVDDHDSFSLTPEYGTLFRNVRSNRRRIVRSPGGTLMAPSPVPTGITSAVTTIEISTPTVTGSQSYVHDLADIPLGYLFTAAHVITDGIEQDVSTMIGLSDGTNYAVKCRSAKNGSDPTVGHTTVSTAACIRLIDTAGTLVLSGVVTASDAETLTIDWTVVDTVSYTILVTMVGGSGVTCALLSWNIPTSTGDVGVTGAGFTPQIVMHLPAVAGQSLVFGAMTTGAQFSTDGHLISNSSPTTSERIASQTKCIASLTGIVSLAPTVDFSCVYKSMDADGFTVTCDNAPANIIPVASLCIVGMGEATIGHFTRTTASAPTMQSVASVGFKPDWVFLSGVNAANNAAADSMVRSLGHGTLVLNGVWSEVVKDGSHTFARQHFLDTAIYSLINVNGVESARGTLQSTDSDGFTISWPINNTSADVIAYIALKAGASGGVGVIRNYAQVYVGPASTVDEKLLMLTSKSAFIYDPIDESTGIWDATSEFYNGTDTQRFSIVNTQAIAAWSQGVDNIRQWDGVTFSPLVQVGQNHAARALIAFADRIISIRPFFGGIDHQTQIRWCVDGNVNNWTGAGSGALEIIETSQNPLVTGFVLGSRAYLAKQRELIELIWTGTTSPVFGTTPRVRGMGILAPHSVGLGEQFAFWLGPDDVYMWDGSTLTPIGERIYNTIDPLIDYNNLDTIQGAVWTPDDLYLLVVPPYRFVYDYRRDIWYQDDIVNFEAIGIFQVGTNFTADIDHSEFVVIGDSALQTIREVPTLTDYLGVAIDSYWTSKDYTAEELRQSFGFQVSLWNNNSLREVRFQSNAGYIVEVGISVDRGTTWQTTNVTVNSQGVGVAWFQVPFNQIRFRFRRYAIEPYEIHGQWGIDYEDAGYELPDA